MSKALDKFPLTGEFPKNALVLDPCPLRSHCYSILSRQIVVNKIILAPNGDFTNQWRFFDAHTSEECDGYMCY